jgi:hypothetical protein
VSEILLILREDIALESDLALAQAELAALCAIETGIIAPVPSLKHLEQWVQNHAEGDKDIYMFASRAVRREGVIGFSISGVGPGALQKIVERSAFTQECVSVGFNPKDEISSVVNALSRTRVLPKGQCVACAVSLLSILEYSALLITRRDKVGNVRAALDALVLWLLDGTPPPHRIKAHLEAALHARKNTLYLSHELHLYKGKFFPRLVHSLINRYAPIDRPGLICDPFIGSGTALLESALLGHDSIGIDVDPTSVLISQNKLIFENIDSCELQEVHDAMQAAVNNGNHRLIFDHLAYDRSNFDAHKVPVPEPMRSRLIKRGKEEGYDLLGEIEKDSAVALLLISQVPIHLKPLFRVCLSHALTKKLRLRFVGIGNGRFTFDVAKISVLDMFLKKAGHMLGISEGFAWLQSIGVKLGHAKVIRDSALNIGQICGSKKIDLVVTSPPYIPASSGREHYARARAIPLVLTGAAKLEELEELDKNFMGEMSNQSTKFDAHDFSPQVRRTLDFLYSDQQRLPKFAPTLQYYRDTETVLKGTRDCLVDGGSALFVVASSHTFYIHKTKEIVHTVDAAGAMCELGEKAGLRVENVIQVPLKKSGGLNARPRSTDDYAEAVVVFRKD